MLRSKTCSFLFIVVLLLTPLASTAQEDSPRVVASYSILADVAQQAAGKTADVTSLAPIGANPHGFTPTPRDLTNLADADVIFTVGAGFEEGLNETIANAGTDFAIVEVSTCVPILPFGTSAEDTHEEGEEHEGEHDHEHDADHHAEEQCLTHDEELAALGIITESTAALGPLYMIGCVGEHDHDAEEEEEHSHSEGSCDPHVWMDPHNVMRWTLVIRDTLSELDPANAEVYAANAEAYITELNTLTEEVWLPALASIPAEQRKIVTNHGAFNYLATLADLEVVGLVIPAASDMAETSAAETAALIDLIQAEGVPAIFAETTSNPELAEQVAAETGATFHTLYTGSLSEADGPAATYAAYMTHNIQTIVESLGGTFEK